MKMYNSRKLILPEDVVFELMDMTATLGEVAEEYHRKIGQDEEIEKLLTLEKVEVAILEDNKTNLFGALVIRHYYVLYLSMFGVEVPPLQLHFGLQLPITLPSKTSPPPLPPSALARRLLSEALDGDALKPPSPWELTVRVCSGQRLPRCVRFRGAHVPRCKSAVDPYSYRTRTSSPAERPR